MYFSLNKAKSGKNKIPCTSLYYETSCKIIHNFNTMTIENKFIAAEVGAGIFIVTLTAILFSRSAQNINVNKNSGIADTAPESNNVSLEDGVRPSEKKVLFHSAAAGAAELTYDNALDGYYDKRIQIFNCSAPAPRPPQYTMKSGTKVMLDNRSPDNLEVALGDKTYRLYGYDFVIVTLSSQTLPTTLRMHCQMGEEVGKNIAQILLQA